MFVPFFFSLSPGVRRKLSRTVPYLQGLEDYVQFTEVKKNMKSLSLLSEIAYWYVDAVLTHIFEHLIKRDEVMDIKYSVLTPIFDRCNKTWLSNGQ